MPIAVQTPVFDTLSKAADKVASKNNENAGDGSYWWRTSGHDIAHMLEEADYPEDIQRQLLTFYKDILCPQLGNPPAPESAKASAGWDGNPLSFSFELRESVKNPKVRFVADLTELRPAPKDNPLGTSTTDKLIEVVAKRTPGYDDTFVCALRKVLVYDHLPPTEQANLITKAGQQSSIVGGFDIHRQLPTSDALPVLAKIYYLPGFLAAHANLTKWQACVQALQTLPSISNYPNILQSAACITDYFSDKPEAWQQGVRWLATDLAAPDQARFKMYMRVFGSTFDEIWDFYTLGGRIPNLDDDREKFRDLMDMVSGTTYADARSKEEIGIDRYNSNTQKLTTIYFNLSAANPTPAPKLCIYPMNFAPNDLVIAKGLDQWLRKYGWLKEGEKSMEERVKNVLYVVPSLFHLLLEQIPPMNVLSPANA